MRNVKRKLFIKSVLSGMYMFGWVMLILSAAPTAYSQDTNVFPIPDTYKVEGIPTIKNSEVEHLFYDPSAIRSNLIWDADKKNRSLLVTDEMNNVYSLDTPLSQPKKLIDKIIPNSVKTNPNGESFAYTSDHEDEDNYQLYLYDFKDRTPKKLISLNGKDESVNSFIWSKKGDSLFYVRVDYDSKTSKLCQYNFLAEKCYPTELKGVWDVIQNSGNKVLLKYWKASSSQFLYVYDIQENKLTPIDEKGNSRKAFFVGDRVFWTSEGNENCKKEPCILSLNLKNNKLSQLKLPETILSLYEVKISPEGNNLLIQETKDGIDTLHIFQLKKDKVHREVPPFISDYYVIWNTRWLSDKEVVYTLEAV